ncbi:FtsQ-type POTRA domain-containing protein [Sphingomonas ginkgonis]|uniref:Cell division protein FtsQ n=1 Tax=Sphingomonas ginkgonis TaxID=2315330 RepID=A0A3R9WRX1_9SPHN|nr:cell division protein FtsQ/DivIB [Sphingomonas ginkgonis]RST30345.1 FtsQ-type POTRA domain-containing protein [Sphingomonas ginkgonis]
MAAAGARKGKAKKGGRPTAARKLAAALPLEEGSANKLAGWGIGLFVAFLVALLIVAFGIPRLIGEQLGEAVGGAGFELKRVDIKGNRHMATAPIYAIAFDQPSKAMPLVDVAAVRGKLLQFGWVKDARVSRRLPDTLAIDIVERTPAAVWQNREQLNLVDGDGVVLQKVPVDRMPDLPLLIGPGANGHARELGSLIAAVPTLKPQLVSATWIGGRRWDLAFQSGETISLPEGDTSAAQALARFARLDKSSGLLGRGILRFDLRLPDKMIVRLPRAPGESLTPSTENAG